MFADVPARSPFCRWIEELARRGVVGGCGGGNYCPTGAVTREQMAVFVLRTLDPTLNPPACATPVFADVPATSGVLPLDRGADPARRGHRLRRRQLLPDRPRHPRADGRLHQRDVRPDAVRSVRSTSSKDDRALDQGPGARQPPRPRGPQTVVPNSRPASAEAPIASAPQNVTRTAPRSIGAPPTRAASAPSTASNTSALPVTTWLTLRGEASAATSTGRIAPAAKVTPRREGRLERARRGRVRVPELVARVGRERVLRHELLRHLLARAASGHARRRSPSAPHARPRGRSRAPRSRARDRRARYPPAS